MDVCITWYFLFKLFVPYFLSKGVHLCRFRFNQISTRTLSREKMTIIFPAKSQLSNKKIIFSFFSNYGISIDRYEVSVRWSYFISKRSFFGEINVNFILIRSRCLCFLRLERFILVTRLNWILVRYWED